MALFRKLFYRKPPDGLLEICERVYVFDCCFTTDAWEQADYKVYVGGIIGHLREYYPDASILVFNFREGGTPSQIASALSDYDMTIMDYPRHYEGCPLLSMEVIHHFLRSSESWLSLGQQNVLLMHCERGGWPVLAFMLAALLIYRKQYTGEHKTLDMVYKQAPRELLHLLSPLNPLPSQLRYLQYVSRRNVASEWPPLDRALTMDCVIIRMIPDFDGNGGCCPIFRIYGQDPFLVGDRSSKILFSTPKKSKGVRHYKQAECELVKIDINCNIQGDVVLECISLHDDMEREQMIFRAMFNTAFIRSNILMLNRDDIDILWDAKDHFPKDFRAEVLFSEMDAVAPTVPGDLSCFEEKEGLPVEAFAKVHEIFSHVDWLVPNADAALNVLQHIAVSDILQEKLEIGSHHTVDTTTLLHALTPKKNQDKQSPTSSESKTKSSSYLALEKHLLASSRVSTDVEAGKYKDEHQAGGPKSNLVLPPTPPPPPPPPQPRSPPSGESLVASLEPITSPSLPSDHLSTSESLYSSTAEKSDPYFRGDEESSLVPVPLEIETTSSGTIHKTSYSQAFPPTLTLPLPILPLDKKPAVSSPPLPAIRVPSPPPQTPTSPPTLLREDLVTEMEQSISPPTPTLKDTTATRVGPPPPASPPPPPPPHPSTPPLTEKSATRTGPPPAPPPPPAPTLKNDKGTRIGPPPAPPPPPAPTLKNDEGTRIGLPPAPPPPLTSTLKNNEGTRIGPPPAPPPPTYSFREGQSARSEWTPPPPPLPPPPTPPLKEKSGLGAGPPAPPPPPLRVGQAAEITVTSVPPPPPPPAPSSSSKHFNSASQNSSTVPSAPPPPAPSVRGDSKMGAVPPPPQSHSAGSNVPGSPSPPPPLAPPSGTKGRGISRTTTSRNNQTKKLKPLHWLKLTRAVQGSLWAEAQKSGEASKAPEIDLSELESLFSAAIPNLDQGSPGSKSNSRSLGQKSDKVQLIDHRRAYNCEIMLSKVKIPLHDLMSSVLALEDSALDVDQVDNLIKFCPTKEEMEMLKGYKGEKDKLGKCEQFFLELMQVPRTESKLRVFSFKMQFRSQVSDLRSSLNTVNSAVEQVRGSAKLKRVMQTILSLGNALNQGTARGSAVGFRLDSLLKLTETRARNNRMTLMHYLCKVLADKLPELLDFSKDLTSLEPASKIQLKFLAEEMQAISKGLEKVVQELSMSENDGPVSENFRKALKEFLCSAEGEVRSLASLYSGVGKNVDALILYFGEDPTRCQYEQVVSTLLNFVRMFNQAHEENCKQLELERKKVEKEVANEKLKTTALHKDSEHLRNPPIKSVK